MSTNPPPSTNTPTTPTRQPTFPLPPHTILPPTPPNITQTISIISRAFISTPLLIAFMSELNDWTPTTPHDTITTSITSAYYTDGITRLATHGGLLVESGSFSTIAIWEPPSYAAADFSSERKKWGPASREWTARVKAARIKFLGIPGQNVPLEEVDEFTQTKLRPFWHLGFLARDPEREKVKGAVSAVVVPFLDRAREEGVPVWLEATTPEGVRMYEAWGFRLVDTITVAKGLVGRDGWPAAHGDGEGEGVSGFCMIWDGHLR